MRCREQFQKGDGRQSRDTKTTGPRAIYTGIGEFVPEIQRNAEASLISSLELSIDGRGSGSALDWVLRVPEQSVGDGHGR